MRLLKRLSNGDLELVSFANEDDALPPYAVLSHTWGEESEEVTFDDMIQGIGQHKAGFEKIRFCAERAAQDDLQYFWVDSCCINKRISVELQHAIPSIFRWYRRSTKCYVYLSDIPNKTCVKREQAFHNSRWFKRGWTLQELLAPSSVEFFSADHCLLGDKQSLEQQIHEITHIPKLALQGAPLSQFNVDERLMWLDRRETKLPEDMVYSLLGIFDIEMPLFYGEGWVNANSRLIELINKRERCIQDLRLTDPRDEKRRIEYEKGGLLKDSYRWILENSNFKLWQDEQHSRLLWVKGDPGKGKTMLLCGIINELNNSIVKTDLVSFCFCVATDARINSATSVLRRLIYMIVCQQPSLVSHIRNRYDTAGKALFEDPNAWFSLCDILTDILEDRKLNSTYLIIDALDECIAADLPRLLEFIVAKSSVSLHVKWIVSSRNWPSIEKKLKVVDRGIWLCLELNGYAVSAAVESYVQFKIDQLAKDNDYTDNTKDAIRQYLLLHAEGTFLWVALVCRELAHVSGYHAEEQCRVFPLGLEPLYERMLRVISDSSFSTLCKRVLAIIPVVRRPITLDELAVFIDTSAQNTRGYNVLPEIVKLCGSFLTLEDSTVSFVHQSAREFLVEKAYKEIYPSGTELVHYNIFSRSLQIMSKLKRNMYGLGTAGISIDDIEQSNPDLLSPVRYSCVYWISHLLNCDFTHNAANDIQDGGSIDLFLSQHYLYWLEALSLCKNVSEGLVYMRKLVNFLQAVSSSYQLIELAKDAYRFIMSHKQPIQNNPLQTYVSALIFSPTNSQIKRAFQEEVPKWTIIKPSMDQQWSPCLQTLEGHAMSVTSVVFSHNSAQLASGSSDSTIKIWDADSGECLRTLEGHSNGVYSVAFSHDSKQLASASDDGTVRIWNSHSGACLLALKGHGLYFRSVAFSHDSKRLVASSLYGDIIIWDSNTGKYLFDIKNDNDIIHSVVYSHDSKWLASVSEDSTIKIWDADSGEYQQTLVGHSDWVFSAVFSHDSAHLASASKDYTVKIWRTDSGECFRTLGGHSHYVSCVAFSHDSVRLVSASWDCNVKIWHVDSGECLQTFEGHSQRVLSVAFSHDSTRLVSASVDGTVKIWEADSTGHQRTLDDHTSYVRFVTFSRDSKRLVSASDDSTIKIWDADSGECLRTLEGHNMTIKSVVFSHNSTRLASASWDCNVKIWDADSGECLQTLEGHKRFVNSVAFSHDSSQLVSGSDDKTVKIWRADSGECQRTFIGHTELVWSAVFSHDSSRLASASDDKTVKLWDADSGECLRTFEDLGGCPVFVTFSPESTRLASVADDHIVKIWDVTSGECLQMLTVNEDYVEHLHLRSDARPFFLDALLAANEPADHSKSRTTGNLDTGFGIKMGWITYKLENLIWLPSKYRPSCWTVSGNRIGIGVGSGKVWICEVQIDKKSCRSQSY